MTINKIEKTKEKINEAKNSFLEWVINMINIQSYLLGKNKLEISWIRSDIIEESTDIKRMIRKYIFIVLTPYIQLPR